MTHIDFDKGIDVDIFFELNENDAKEILKDFVLGIQLKFWKKYTQWKRNAITVNFEEMYANSFSEDTLSSIENINNKIEKQKEPTETNEPTTSISREELVEFENVPDNTNNNDLESDAENKRSQNKVETQKRQNLAETENPSLAKKKNG
ncbi:uncharacterized protein LOC116852199 [Odontomachus brunneus]|uniref:uncharacterized protein LOC116852199 n=1 Tax=Odontomachus brunneus TaxID=486640 RepID=UPI0013F1A4AF|nr:uncharacterized protein LOC116852199 [Odontomachus brunneus]